MKKICNTCKEEKDLSSFKKGKLNKDGYTPICKKCIYKNTKIYRSINKEKLSKKASEYYLKNKEHITTRNKQYRKDNIDSRKAYEKNYRKDNKEKIKETNRKYILNNKEKISLQRKEYKEENRGKINTAQRERWKKDSLHRLKRLLSSRTWKAFNVSRWNKNGNTEELLGTTYKEAMQHIESLFTKNMSWDKMGEIHIDHKIPLSSAKNEKELLELCHFTNLQPLWKIDNLVKCAKIVY